MSAPLYTAPRCSKVYVHEVTGQVSCSLDPGHPHSHKARIGKWEQGRVWWKEPDTTGIVATDYWITWDDVDPYLRAFGASRGSEG
jgi:hypothetical protein